MSRFACRAGLLGLAASLLAAPDAPAQSRNLYTPPTTRSPYQDQPPPPPPGPSGPAPYAGGTSGFNAKYANAQYGSGGYGGYGGYGYGLPYGGSRTGDALQGASSYVQSQGNYKIQIQEAKLGR